MLLAAASAAFVAAVIQRITGLGFVLVLIGPVVLFYGGREGVTLGVLLALVASLAAVPLVWPESCRFSALRWRRECRRREGWAGWSR